MRRIIVMSNLRIFWNSEAHAKYRGTNDTICGRKFKCDSAGNMWTDIEYDPFDLANEPQMPPSSLVEKVTWKGVFHAGFRKDGIYKAHSDVLTVTTKTQVFGGRYPGDAPVMQVWQEYTVNAIGTNACYAIILDVREGRLQPTFDFTNGCDDAAFLGARAVRLA